MGWASKIWSFLCNMFLYKLWNNPSFPPTTMCVSSPAWTIINMYLKKKIKIRRSHNPSHWHRHGKQHIPLGNQERLCFLPLKKMCLCCSQQAQISPYWHHCVSSRDPTSVQREAIGKRLAFTITLDPLDHPGPSRNGSIWHVNIHLPHLRKQRYWRRESFNVFLQGHRGRDL